MKKLWLIVVIAAALVLAFGAVSTACAAQASADDTHVITLSSTENADGTYTQSATLDGAAVTEYDYVWHADPGEAHDEVSNSPAEYYTGEEPAGDEAVYIAHDIYYYPELDESGFVKVQYDDDTEWAYYYTAEGYEDYIFATLPVDGSSVPTEMMHSEEEAYENAVLHITEAGTYIIEGEWHGQIWIDLGDTDDTFADESAKVTVILNGVDVTCTVAPALVFYSAYECDNGWEEQTAWSAEVDTSEAGANVIIADGTVNNFSGENVYRMLKAKYKSEDSQDSATGSVALQKKARKMDAAFYSYVSMNIDGEAEESGVLNITSSYEGLDTELHLTINGGNINVASQDDGINVNEDGVSVVTFNGGSTHVLAGLGSEGDGIDSNGYLVVNGGTLVTMANPRSDSGMDSDCGTYVNGGTVVALGSTMDWAETTDTASDGQATMNLRFASAQSADEAIIITDTDGKVVFAYDPDKDEIAGNNARSYQGAIISDANLQVGGSYYVYVGGDVTGSETAGIYDASTVSGFSADAKQQCYTGAGVGGMGGGMGGMPGRDGQRPDGGTGEMGGTPPERPDGETGTPPARPDGEMGGQRPDGMNGGTPPERPDGEMPDGQMPDGMNGGSGEASVIFTLAEKVNGFSGVTDYNGTGSGFADVQDSDWFAADVAYVFDNGLMQGTSATSFSPNVTTSRGMIVTILWRLAGEPAAADSTFADVAEGSYYEDAIAWAAANGVVKGYSSSAFGPDDSITREQMAAILYRYAELCGYDVSGSSDLAAYTDRSSVSEYALSAMQWANAEGLITGMTGTTLSPQGSATRAQAAAILHRFCEDVAA
ncbi:MAG: S-layer homology domain-containing protein [Firmicutes bacterium]|nr:S-layer homology domain-containing protein [Bacillota bacterium]